MITTNPVSAEVTVSKDVLVSNGTEIAYQLSGDTDLTMSNATLTALGIEDEELVQSFKYAIITASKDFTSSDVVNSKDVTTSADTYTTSGDLWLTFTYSILSGDTTENIPNGYDEEYINVGVLQVTGKLSAVKKQAVSIVANNYGTEVTGKISITITEGSTTAAKNNAAVGKNSAVVTRNGKGTSTVSGTKFATVLPQNAQAYSEKTADEAEAEEDADETEAVTIGEARTVADLTEAQKAFITEQGYQIVAVLPEITANVEGQQDFEVELYEDAPEGAKLIWLPFPQDVEETEDDKIADFFDEEGAEIEEVPAGKTITVSPWLREGVTYQPVIAVENAD